MTYYYYLDISLEFHQDFNRRNITHAFFKKHVMHAVKTLFGEIGVSVTVDILKYNPDTRRAILRVPADFYVKLHSSLTLCGEYEGIHCAYRVHKTSPLLLTLLGDSRDYIH